MAKTAFVLAVASLVFVGGVVADIVPPPQRRGPKAARINSKPRAEAGAGGSEVGEAQPTIPGGLLALLGKRNVVVIVKGASRKGEAVYFAVPAVALRQEGPAIRVRERSRLVSATSSGPDADVAQALLEEEGGLFYGPLSFQKQKGHASVSGTARSAPPQTFIEPVALVRADKCSDWPAWAGLCS